MPIKKNLLFKSIIGALLAGPLLWGNSFASSWPAAAPIRFVVPSAAAGTPDISSRRLAAYMQDTLRQSVVVDNRPGAAGTIGTQIVANAKADGYTIGLANVVTMAISRSLITKLPYNPEKDLEPVSLTTFTPILLAVRKDLPVNSVSELIAYAKAHPGKLFIGSSGNGTTSHLSAEMLKDATNISYSHIPYKGAPQALNELMGGQIDIFFDNVPSVAAAVKSGKVRALAITGAKRIKLFPELPTMREAGVKDFEIYSWGGVVVPSGTSPEIIDKLNKVVNSWLESPAAQAEFAQNGQEVIGGSPESFRKFMKTEYIRWGKVIQKNNIKLD